MLSCRLVKALSDEETRRRGEKQIPMTTTIWSQMIDSVKIAGELEGIKKPHWCKSIGQSPFVFVLTPFEVLLAINDLSK
jgi:hypothetical protein